MLSETLKLLMTSMEAVARHSSELQLEAMKLLVQLMIVCAQLWARERHPALGPLVSQTMMLLASGKCGAAFRSALLTLTPASRNTLQVRLFVRIDKSTLGRMDCLQSIL